MDKISQLKEVIKNSTNIVFFGGAGVSTESLIPDFRSEDGLFTTKGRQVLAPERILSHSFFIDNPEEFYLFYRAKMLYPKAKPNPAHLALAKLEQEHKLSAIVTQNIDGLHQLAGSKSVFELHGSVHHNYCMDCNKYYSLAEILQAQSIIPRCNDCGGIIKPDVVLYEEPLNDSVVSGAVAAIRNAEVLIVGGSSLVVYPAAGFLNYFSGKQLILINRDATGFDKQADLVINDYIGKVLSAACYL